MTQLLTTGVQAFIACNAHGRAEPVVVSVFGRSADGTDNQSFTPQTILVLEQLLDITGYSGLLSFSIHEDNLDFMEARVMFVMDELFASENRFLMARCDTYAAAQAFVEELQKQYTTESLRQALRSHRAAQTSLSKVSHAHTGGNAP